MKFDILYTDTPLGYSPNWKHPRSADNLVIFQLLHRCEKNNNLGSMFTV